LPVIEISCLEVWREISSYIDNDLDPELRARIDYHLKNCKHCSAVFDGTANTVRLLADDKAFELPTGFSQRLQQRIAKEAKRKK
jgi:predicted anti-sigma-YlaC factor YlaD